MEPPRCFPSTSCSGHTWLSPHGQVGSRDSCYLPRISHTRAPYLPLPRCSLLLPESSGDSRCNVTCWQSSCRTPQRCAGCWHPAACCSLSCCNTQEDAVTVVNLPKAPSTELLQTRCFEPTLSFPHFLSLSSSLTACCKDSPGNRTLMRSCFYADLNVGVWKKKPN